MNDRDFFYDDTDSESSDEEELGIQKDKPEKVRFITPRHTLFYSKERKHRPLAHSLTS